MNDSGGSTSRKSYPKEFKISAIDFYYANGKNNRQTSKKFGITPKMLRNWLKDEKNIRKLDKGQRAQRFRKEAYPDVEKKLYDEYQEMRRKRLKVKGFWFRMRAKVK